MPDASEVSAAGVATGQPMGMWDATRNAGRRATAPDPETHTAQGRSAAAPDPETHTAQGRSAAAPDQRSWRLRNKSAIPHEPSG